MSNISLLEGDGQELFSAKAEWEDIVPLQQYEGPNPLAPIFYTAEYQDATDYFRGIVKKGEKSPRVLELTETIIRINPAHYSAWQYRYETLLALSADLATELKLMDELGVKFLKNYQVWHHRRLLVTLTKTPRAELAFIKEGLEVDEKNYHTWSYRQWLLAHFDGITSEGNIWDGELDFLDAMLTKDLRNNSAWHHRFFVVWGYGVREGEEDRLAVFRRELTYVKQSISVAPNNPSAWNYLRGILEHNALPFATVRFFVLPYNAVALSMNDDTIHGPTQPVPPSVPHTVGDIVDLENPLPSETAELPVPAAIEFMADIWEKDGTTEALDKAIELWTSLATQYDTIRKKYWQLRIRDAQKALMTLQGTDG